MENDGYKLSIFAQDVADVTVTNPTALTETITDAILIPAGRFTVDDAIDISACIKIVGTGGGVLRMYIDPTPTPTFLGATQISGSFSNALGLRAQDHRLVTIKSATNTECMSVNQDIHMDWNAVSVTNAASSFNIDWTIDHYLVLTVQLISALDTSVTRSFYIVREK